MSKVSIIIPSRNEPYLARTIQDVLEQATGDIEVIAVLDGWWPSPILKDDPRVRLLHWGEPKGLRSSVNAAVQMSTGEFLFKLDAHCALSKGYDEALASVCDDHEIVVPAKYSLVPETWKPFRDPWHYFYLTWPWEIGLPCVGLQDKNYGREYNELRAHIPIDDIVSYQGSAWMLRRTHWDRIGPMDGVHYYYAQEPQELGFKTWLGGGRVKIIKSVWYAHLWKGSGVNKRQFKRLLDPWNKAMEWSARYWMTNQWPQRIHDFSWLIEKFGPFPGWPEDWEAEATRRLS